MKRINRVPVLILACENPDWSPCQVAEALVERNLHISPTTVRRILKANDCSTREGRLHLQQSICCKQSETERKERVDSLLARMREQRLLNRYTPFGGIIH